MIDRRLFIGAGFACVVLTNQAEAEAEAMVDARLDELVRARDFHGAVLAVSGGAVRHRTGYGQADVERGLPNTPETRYKIGSISKALTTGAVLALVQQGKVRLDHPITRHIADAPAAWAEIRVRHLLNHSSGLPEIMQVPGHAQRMAQRNTLEGTVALLHPLPLAFTPGTRFQYGNSGHTVAGRLVESVTAMAYPDALRSLVLDVHGLSDTGYADSHASIPGLAVGYRVTNGVAAPAPFIDMSVTLGAAAEYSTVDDLHRWLTVLETGALAGLARDSGMFTPGPGPVGLAWTIGDFENRRMVSHAGGMVGFVGFMARFPDQDVTVVALSNRENAPVNPVVMDLARALMA